MSLIRVVTNTLVIAAVAVFMTACNPDPTKDKSAAEVHDAVDVADGPSVDMPMTGQTTDESTEPEISDAPEAEVTPPDAVEAAPAGETVYTIDKSNSSIAFTGSKVTGNHSGGWSEYSGTVKVPGDDLTKAAITVDIDMKSTFADDKDLADNLKSENFFEVETYPTSKFVSTSIEKTDDGYNVSGNLTLHGITKNLTFPAKITVEGGTLTAEAEFSFNRKIFDINYDGMANDLIRDNVLMTFYVEAKSH